MFDAKDSCALAQAQLSFESCLLGDVDFLPLAHFGVRINKVELPEGQGELPEIESEKVKGDTCEWWWFYKWAGRCFCRDGSKRSDA